MPFRSVAAALAVFLGVAGAGQPASAHHGWRWAEEGNFTISGVIRSTKLGYPHGEVTIEADGRQWRVEVGQPWRNERAGLKDAMLVEGVRITVIGHRSKDRSERRVKAERVVIDGTTYILYPDRD